VHNFRYRATTYPKLKKIHHIVSEEKS